MAKDAAAEVHDYLKRWFMHGRPVHWSADFNAQLAVMAGGAEHQAVAGAGPLALLSDWFHLPS
jgi:hypothetical protein